MLTLTDVVDQILPPGTRRVNGPPVTPVQVSRVAVLADTDLPTVDRATLAVVAGPDAAADTADLLSTAPAALVVSSGHEVPAFEVDYPILMLPPGVEARNVAGLVSGRLQDEQTRLALQGIDVYRRLAELAIAGKGLSGIASAVAVLLSLPVAVADEDWRPVCAFGIDGAPAPEPEEHILHGLRERLRPILERERLSPSAPPVLHVALAREPHTYVVAPIVLPTGPAGYVWVDAAPATLFPLVDGDPARLHHSYVEAREAARIGLATRGPGATTPFDKLGVYRLLFRLRESPELETFCDELLGPLERYDKARGTDLVHTLERYLACNCNVARATEELH